MEGPTNAHWYANYGRKYHAEASNWISSGLGVCGAAIRNPGFTLRDDAAFRQAALAIGNNLEQALCKRCLAKLKGDAS